jgi:hypothetical protein
MQKQTESKETNGKTGTCVGIHEFIDWEIIQYRREVDAHRLDLSRIEGRCVAWQEAEQDYNSADRAVMEEKWRNEYCGHICTFRENCLTAAHFLNHRRPMHLSRAG